MLASAEQKITSSLAGLLVSAVPLVGVVIATSLGNREHLGVASIGGLLLGVAGGARVVCFGPTGSALVALVVCGVGGGGVFLGPRVLPRSPQAPSSLWRVSVLPPP